MVATKEQIKDKPKDTTIRARVDNETIQKLNYCVKVKKMSISGIIRLGIDKVYEELQK